MDKRDKSKVDLTYFLWYTDFLKAPKKIRKLYKGKARGASKALVRKELKDYQDDSL